MVLVYRHPDTEKEKVIIIAYLFSVTTDVEFSLLCGGPLTTFAQISYKWASSSFKGH